MRLNEKTEPE